MIDQLLLALSPILLFSCLVGVTLGILWGAMPGLSTTMAMALLIGLSAGMSQHAALMFMLGVYTGSVFGGAISAVLINIPGTPDAGPTMKAVFCQRFWGRGPQIQAPSPHDGRPLIEGLPQQRVAVPMTSRRFLPLHSSRLRLSTTLEGIHRDDARSYLATDCFLQWQPFTSLLPTQRDRAQGRAGAEGDQGEVGLQGLPGRK